MGQTQRGKPEAPAVGGAGPDRSEAPSRADVESIGRYLARERRLRGISLQELSATTRIPLRSLERLESGAFDADPDGFVRGFVRTVARALGLPPEETLARMLPEVDASAAVGGARAVLGRPVLLCALALALVGGAYALWAVWTPAPLPHAPRRGEDWVYRRDAVRELAREQAAAAAGVDAPSPADPALRVEESAASAAQVPASEVPAGAGGAPARAPQAPTATAEPPAVIPGPPPEAPPSALPAPAAGSPALPPARAPSEAPDGTPTPAAAAGP